MRAFFARLVTIRVSRILIINSLSSVIGFLVALNIAIVYPYRHVLYGFWRDLLRCVTGASH